MPRGSGMSTCSKVWSCGRFLRVFGIPGDSEVLKSASGSIEGVSGNLEVSSDPTGSMCPSVGRFEGGVALMRLGSFSQTLSSFAGAGKTKKG